MVDLKAAAEKGSAEAQYKLGLAHGKGEGVKQDAAEALKWLQNAAEHPSAAEEVKQRARHYLDYQKAN